MGRRCPYQKDMETPLFSRGLEGPTEALGFVQSEVGGEG